MPYPNAHLYVLALIPATLLGFWPGYFSDVSSGSIAFHAHAITATAWILLLAFQCWSIHNRRAGLHRRLGTFSLGLFPFFMGGFFMVLQTESRKTLVGEDPFKVAIGPGIGAITLIAIGTIAYLYYEGLKNRRNVQLHARYLLAIPFVFSESVFGRIFNSYVPGMIVADVDDVPLIYLGFHLSQLLAIALAMYLYARARSFGRPFLVVTVALILQSVAFESLDGVRWWRELFLAAGQIPVAASISMGLSLGVIASWLGWTTPHPRRIPQSAAQQ